MTLRRGLFLIAVVLVGYWAFTQWGCTTPATIESSAERNAQAYAKKMMIEIKGCSCSGADSDGDGYTSCTLSLAAGPGPDSTQMIECGYDAASDILGHNTGCREWRPKTAIVTP